jgi:uncharacterized protein
MKRKIVIISIILGIIASIAGAYYYFNPLKPRVTIAGHVIYTDYAITPEQQSTGLSYRESLPADSGMLFLFRSRENRTFWMHEMRIPLDIIWIDGNQIADISKNVPILTDGAWTVAMPKVPVDRVLEVNAGTVDRLGLKIGDSVRYNR